MTGTVMMGDIWTDVSGRLQESSMSQASFQAWIDTLEPVDIQENIFRLVTPSEMNRKILNTQYKHLVESAVSTTMGRKMSVSFVLPSDIKKNPPKSDVASAEEQGVFQTRYTFDDFVIGASNRFAHAAALGVAETPADAYNPLFIYGGVGLGKTHLMHAIGHFIRERNPSARILYITSESFTNDLITAIKTNKNMAFRERFRSVDVLLVDDIQFIAGRDSTQEEFFHTFNALHNANKQIVISSDKAPKEIPTLEERLRSRFEWGLIADIQRPDYETRIAILRKKAESELLAIPDEVFGLIAEHVDSSIRELEGSLTRVMAFSKLAEGRIDVEIAKKALHDIFALKDPKRITCDLIQDIVAGYFGITVQDLKSKRRNRELAEARHIAMYLTRQFTDLSLPAVGREFGGRDHTTVIHGHDRIAEEVKREDGHIKVAVEDLRKRIQES